MTPAIATISIPIVVTDLPIAANAPRADHRDHVHHGAGQQWHRIAHMHEHAADRVTGQVDHGVPGAVERHCASQFPVGNDAAQHRVRGVAQQAGTQAEQYGENHQPRDTQPAHPPEQPGAAEQQHTGRRPDQQQHAPVATVLQQPAGNIRRRGNAALHRADQRGLRRRPGHRQHDQRYREAGHARAERAGRIGHQPRTVVGRFPQ